MLTQTGVDKKQGHSEREGSRRNNISSSKLKKKLNCTIQLTLGHIDDFN